MGAFNQTLWDDVQGAGLFRMVPKTMYPKIIPQQPTDWRQPAAPVTPPAGRPPQQPLSPPNGGGLWMTDWSGPPVSANYMAFGYTAVQNGVLVLYGWFWDLGRGSQAFAQRYLASNLDEAGARDVAHEFAADILALFGGQSVFGHPHLFRVGPHRPQGDLGDGSGWRQPAPDHALQFADHPARRVSGRKQDRIH